MDSAMQPRSKDRLAPPIFLLILIALTAVAGLGEAVAGDEALATSRRWVAARLAGAGGADQPGPPLSFVYDGKPSAELLTAWRQHGEVQKLDEQRTRHLRSWTDAARRALARARSSRPIRRWVRWTTAGSPRARGPPSGSIWRIAWTAEAAFSPFRATRASRPRRASRGATRGCSSCRAAASRSPSTRRMGAATASASTGRTTCATGGAPPARTGPAGRVAAVSAAGRVAASVEV
mgnify:CR=1 FL=1